MSVARPVPAPYTGARNGDRGSSAPRGASGPKGHSVWVGLPSDPSLPFLEPRGVSHLRDRRRDSSRLRLNLHPRVGLILAVLAACALLLVVFVGRQAVIGRRNARLADLERKQSEAEEERAALQDRLAAGEDLAQIERLARERLGLVMPGEEKVIFVEEPER
jgi:cell division protein FtsB